MPNIPDALFILCAGIAIAYGAAHLVLLIVKSIAPPPPPLSHKWPICFVLVATDPTAPGVIRHWADSRVVYGLNRLDDELIVHAQKLASEIEQIQREFTQSLNKPQ